MHLPRQLSFLVALAAALSISCSEPTATPIPGDPEALLNDDQLATVLDPAAPAVDPQWEEWIRKNHRTIRSLSASRDDDLNFLKSVIGSRRLVQLGESGHGVQEFSRAKVRLIKYLHEEMGFDVLAFESGMFECWKANELANEAPHVTMGRCIFGVWYTEDVYELFEYLKETRKTSRPLILAGFDVQLSNGRFVNQYAPDLLAEVVGKIDPAYAARVREWDDLFYSRYLAISSLEPFNPVARQANIAKWNDTTGYIAKYDSLRVFLDANANALLSAYPANQERPHLARQTAYSRSQLIRTGLATNLNTALTTRDQGMADNIDFLLDRLYPGKKIMVWAHNAHIMHGRSSMGLVTGPGSFPQSMGAFTAQRRRADLYSIGLFMYRGQAANNAGTPYAVRPALPGSLEAIMYRTRKMWTFVDMLGQTRSAGNSWMFEPTPAKEWGTQDVKFVPRDQFDGILFIDTVNPPTYYTYVPPRDF